MEMLESALKLMAGYPPWAKATMLGALVIVVAVLLFAKAGPDKPATVAVANGPLYLRITRVVLYPEDPKAEIQVISDVNGTEFTFPSLPNVKWTRIGPDMSQKIFPIPIADMYDLRFRINYRSGEVAGNETPHRVVRRSSDATVPQIPHAGEYKLYRVNEGTASSSVVATIHYEVTPNGQ